MMTEQLFLKKAKKAIEILDDDFQPYPHEPEYFQLVWMSHILGNKKAIFIDINHVNEIFEVTYDRVKDEFYVDKYKKDYNGSLKADDVEP